MRLGKFPNKLRHFLSLKCKRQPLRFEAPPNLPPCGMDLPCTLAVCGGLDSLVALGCLCRLLATQVVVQVLVCRVIVEETMDAPVTAQPVRGFTDIGNGVPQTLQIVCQWDCFRFLYVHDVYSYGFSGE